jgi:hypothetical protein
MRKQMNMSSMKKWLSTVLFAAAVVGSSAFTSVTHAAPQACVNSLLSGMTVGGACNSSYRVRPVKVTIHNKNNSWVSYSDGTVAKGSDGNAGGTLFQYFSDRNRFQGAYDQHALVVNGTNGTVTLRNITWGFTQTFPSPVCEGNIIKVTDAGAVFLISFGPLQWQNYHC